MDKGSTIQELSRGLVLPRTREDLFSIPMEEGVRTTIVAPRMVMGMEEATDRIVPTHQHQPRGIPVSSARRLDIMPLNVLKLRMEMSMEALARSRTLLTRDG